MRSRCSRLRASTSAETFVLDGDTVAQLIESAFVPAVMGVSRGDVTELKLFIAAAQAGYDLGCSVEELGEKMRALPIQTAGRPLAAEEDELRALWLSLVFMTLGVRGESSDKARKLVPAKLYEQHSVFV